MRKELLALVSMFVLLLNDPMVAQAYMMVPTDDAGWEQGGTAWICLLYTSPSPRDGLLSRMPSSA